MNTSNKSIRVVADIDHTSFGMLRLSADGEGVFYSAYSAYPPPIGGIYRVTPDGGVVEMLVDSVGTSFAISPDGSSVAYATGTGADSLYLLNVAERSTQAVGVEGRVGYVVGLSPDGKAVLHGGSPQDELRLTSLVDSSTQAIWSEPRSEKSLLGLRWDEGAIQILFAQCSWMWTSGSFTILSLVRSKWECIHFGKRSGTATSIRPRPTGPSGTTCTATYRGTTGWCFVCRST